MGNPRFYATVSWDNKFVKKTSLKSIAFIFQTKEVYCSTLSSPDNDSTTLFTGKSSPTPLPEGL